MKLNKNYMLRFLQVIIFTFVLGVQANTNDSLEKLYNKTKEEISVKAKLTCFKQLLKDTRINTLSNEIVRQYVAEALELTLSNGWLDEQAEIEFLYAGYLLKNAKIKEANEHLKNILTIANKVKTDSIYWKYYYGKGDVELYQGNIDVAKDNFSKALSSIKKIVKPRLKARVLNTIGLCNFRQGNSEIAFQYYRKALEEIKNKNDRDLEVIIYNNIGSVFGRNANYEEAITYFFKGLKKLESTEGNSKSILLLLGNIGMSYFFIGQEDKALQYYLEAFDLAQKSKNYRRLMAISSSIADVYKLKKDYKNAKKYFEIDLKFAKQFNHSENTSIIEISIAICDYMLTKNQLKTNKIIDEIIKRFEIEQNKTNTVAIQYLLAEYHFLSKNYQKAITQLKNNLKITKENKYRYIQPDVLKLLFESYYKVGNLKEAHRISNEFIQIKKRESTENSLKLITTKSLERDFEKEKLALKIVNEKQSFLNSQRLQLQQRIIIGVIIMLGILLCVVLFISKVLRQKKRLNDELNAQHSQLERLNNTKNKLFAILGHDLRSPLDSLRSLITLIHEGIIKEENISEHLNGSARYIDSIHESLENILHWAKNQLEGLVVKASIVPLKELIDDVVIFTKQQSDQKNISVDVHISRLDFVRFDTQQLHLVFRNILSNAIKFTPNQGGIIIKSIKKEDRIVISVADTGIGMDENTVKEIFNKESFEKVKYDTQGAKGTGLGLIISKEFIEKNDGEIWVESQLGKGTTFFIAFRSCEEYKNIVPPGVLKAG